MKNYNKHNQRTNNTNKRSSINLDQAYNELKAAINSRRGNQEYYDNMWTNVKKGHSKHSELQAAGKRIGECTHRINNVISKLSSCNRSHKAMNMAHSYLQTEIKRTKAIISKWQRSISEVKAGKIHWVNSYGQNHTDSTFAYNYLAQKQQYLEKLNTWDNSIRRKLA